MSFLKPDTLVLFFLVFSISAIGQYRPLQLSGAETQAAIVVDVDSGDTLFRYNEAARMTPASLTKLFTTAAALDILGTHYRFSTSFYYDEVRDRVIVKGGGDPSLCSSHFSNNDIDHIASKLAGLLKDNKINKLTGGVVADISFFGDVRQPSLRVWEDMGNYFGALPSSLTFSDNIFRLYLKSPQKIGELCTVVGVEPEIGFKPKSYVLSRAEAGDSAYIYGVAGCNSWYVSGGIPAGRSRFVVRGAMPQPHLVFINAIFDKLGRNGVSVIESDVKTIDVAGDSKLLFSIESPELWELCKVVNKNSNNLYADHLFLAIGRQAGRTDWDSSAKAVQNYIADSLNITSFPLYDGSGLSPFNAFSAGDAAKLLVEMAGKSTFAHFYGSLPTSGIDGTIRNMWRSKDLVGRIKAKSGSMNGVYGYAGYIKRKDGRRLAFCIIVNHHSERAVEVRRKIEEWVAPFVGATR